MSYLHAVIIIANIILLSIIFFYFYLTYREVRSKFALGLVFFSGILLLNGFFLLPMFYELFAPTHSCPYEPFYIIAGGLEFVALAILLVLVRK
jgi:hypothetical protein